MILATTVNTSIRIGNTAVNLTSSANVQQLIATAMSSIHYFALTVSLCIFLLAIVRNYTQFGEHIGVRFIGSLLVVLVMIFSFPKICDAVQNATYSYSQGTSTTMENMFCWLTEQKPNAGKDPSEKQSLAQKIAHFPESMLHAVQAAMCNIFYVNGIFLGKTIRDIVYFIFKCLYNGALCLTPIFFAAMLIPETKHIGVNFIVTTVGIALMPLCFLFGDLCNIWLAEHMWNVLGLGSNGTFWTLARSGQALSAPVGTVLGYVGFGIAYALIAGVVYVVLPFLYMKLFRTGSPGSPVGLMATAIGKAVNAAVVGGSMLATAGTAAPAAGAVTGGSAAATGAANAAQSAAKATQTGSDSAVKGMNKAAQEIDDAANASPGK
ncbi:hypothetical protein [Victivallis vadensis]|uniref:TrbL/VirB6 plasmid conjugal transfer protein n=1 Tax=Victivallis vadensis TaxID=172901 RepID=A0A2U1ATL9_9BACT|nr:hypothetical protein [Victivallis vadensis]PVY39779.1 hypothetical protein C8D82_11920 [Victivallis vadensis]